jgi:uncharacterized membrane protein
MDTLAMSNHWVLGANDNDWVGWGITVAYFVAAALCFACGRRMGSLVPDSSGREYWLWRSVGTVLLLLGVNKQMDLQTVLRDVGRFMAAAEGWYQYRRTVQMGFVAATAIVAIGALMLAGAEMRRAWQQHALLYVGIAILGGFVVLRAAAFNHVGESIKGSAPIQGARFIVEVAGIVCIGLSAVMALRRTSK